MKSLLVVLLALGIASAVFPQAMLKRQTTPIGSLPTASSGMISSSTCRCFQSTQADLLPCLDSHHTFQQFGSGYYCACYDEMIAIDATCPIVKPTGTGSAPVQSACPASWWLSNFDLFCFDSLNITDYSSIDGRIAAMNDIWLKNYRVAYAPSGHADEDEEGSSNSTIADMSCSELKDDDWRYALVAGKNLSLTNGKVYSGDICYGSQYSASTDSLLSTSCQAVKNESILDFAFAQSEISRISSGLMALTPNGQYSVSGGVLTLSGPAQWVSGSVLVFKFLLADLISVRSIKFQNFPVASTLKAIVFNFDLGGIQLPSSFSFDVPSMLSFAGLPEAYESKLVWNFGQLATALTLSSSSVSEYRDLYGLLIAPSCSIIAPGARVRLYGMAFIKSFSCGSFIQEHEEFEFCVTDLVAVSVPTSTASVPTQATATPTIVQTVTTQVPTLVGTTKIPATSSIPVTSQVPTVVGTTKIPATSSIPVTSQVPTVVGTTKIPATTTRTGK